MKNYLGGRFAPRTHTVARHACVIVLATVLAACGGGDGGGGNAALPPPTPIVQSHTLGGTVGGLGGSGLVLQSGAGEALAVTGNGVFTFATPLKTGTAYAVSVKTQPASPAQICSVGKAGGTMPDADVSDVTVLCATNSYTIGLTVSGLTGAGLVLRNNAADDLAIMANGAYTFATPVADGAGYKVTVATQPAGQVCAVVNDQGTATAPVGNVQVTCQVPAVTAPTAAPSSFSATYGAKLYSFSWAPVSGATFYQVSEDPDGVGSNAAAVVGGNLSATSYDYPVDVLHRMNATYTVRACNAAGCGGASTVFTPDAAKAVGYFKSSQGASNIEFGTSVALSADGNTLAAGAPRELSAGAVYVFVRTNGVWTQQAYVKASNTGANDQFGHSVALSADGSTLAVGALQESSSATGINGNQADNSSAGSGAVYVFSRTGSTWAQEAYVKASNTRANAQFGKSVAVSSDGNLLAVGAIGETSAATGVDGSQANGGLAGAGAVYLFARTAGIWSQQHYIKASNTQAGQSFGWSIALSGDGKTLAAGSPTESSAATGIGGNANDTSALSAGSVHVFTFNGTAWSQQAYVKASNTRPNAFFGLSVSLSDDGSTLAAGAYQEDSNATGINGNEADNSASFAGAAYVFSRTANTWSQQAYVKASNTSVNAEFGYSLALSGDGNTLAVGSNTEGSAGIGVDGAQSPFTAANSGAVYTYARAGSVWTQQRYVKATNADAGDQFGTSVALSGDGSALAVGAMWEASNAAGINGDQADNSGVAAGAVYGY
jgi:hypothetical protein